MDSTQATITTRPPASQPHRCACCGAALPSPRGDRRPTLLDAMILVAGLAVALVILRPMWTVLPSNPTTLSTVSLWSSLLVLVLSLLIAGTPTLLALRLRRPRPPLRHLSRQPGFAASLAGTAVISLGWLAVGLLGLVRVARTGLSARSMSPAIGLPRPDPLWWWTVVLHFAPLVGPAVLASWILLALSGRRRPSRNWLDLLGRACGTVWILLFVVNACIRLAALKD